MENTNQSSGKNQADLKNRLSTENSVKTGVQPNIRRGKLNFDETDPSYLEYTDDDVRETLESNAEKEAVLGLIKAVSGYQKIIIVLSVGFIIVAILAAIGFYRRPKVMVSVTTPDGRRIVKLDDVNFGAVEPVQMGADNLNNDDKKYLVNQFLSNYYGVDLASRSRDIQKALGLMIPSSAKRLWKALNERGYLQIERDEAWAATWDTEKIEVSPSDPNLIEVIGTQTLRKRLGGEIKEERNQYKIVFRLFTEGKRDDTPLRSGYWITQFNADSISRK